MAVPDCPDASHKSGGVYYLYKDTFATPAAYKNQMNIIIQDLKNIPQYQPISASQFNELAFLMTGVWAMRIFKKRISFPGLLMFLLGKENIIYKID